MLIGQYEHTLDLKGRFNFPAKMRETLGERFFITRGLDNCLFVYSAAEWATLEENIRALPMSRSRDLQRFFFAGAVEVEADKQGRVLLPQNLRDYASLDRDIVVIGASVRAEIWNAQEYHNKYDNFNADSIAQAMDELGF